MPLPLTLAFACEVAICERVPLSPENVVSANVSFPAGAGTVAVQERAPPESAEQDFVDEVRFIVYAAVFETGGAPFTCTSVTTIDCGVVTPALGAGTNTVNDAVLLPVPFVESTTAGDMPPP